MRTSLRAAMNQRGWEGNAVRGKKAKAAIGVMLTTACYRTAKTHSMYAHALNAVDGLIAEF